MLGVPLDLGYAVRKEVRLYAGPAVFLAEFERASVAPSLFLLDDNSLELFSAALFLGKEGQLCITNGLLSLGSRYLTLLLRSTLLMMAS